MGRWSVDSDHGSQWIFLADTTVQLETSWLLAVHLRAGPCAINYLDGSSAKNQRAILRNIRLTGKDESNLLWQVSLAWTPAKRDSGFHPD